MTIDIDHRIESAEPVDAQDIPPVAVPSVWDDETDIIILGAGGSGLCAAAAALKNGARVILVEKEPATGGHSQHGGAAATFNTKAAKRRRLQANRAKAFKHTYTVQSNSTIDPRILATLIDRSHEVYDWAETESWGNRWDAFTLGYIPDQGVARMIVKGTMPSGGFTSGTQLVAQMYPWMQWLEKDACEKGAKILLNTKALALVLDGERVVGVEAQTVDGKIIHLKASKAVILAGGGFTNNRAMLKKYIPNAYETACGSFCPPTDTGEIIRMALGAGADVAGKNTYMAFAGGIPFHDTTYTGKSEPGPWFQYLRQGWLQLARGNGWLEINTACEEYLPDAARADYEMHPRASGATQNHATFSIFDANFETTIWETLPPPMLDDRPMTKDDPEYSWFEPFRDLAPKDWMESVRCAQEMGGIKTADTVEGLAAALGLDPKKFSAAVKTWNAKAAAGKIDEFGRLPQNMKPVLKPPFYGIKSGPLLGSTYCGTRVNFRFEVMDKNYDPIPGLYAAGLSAGGMNGEGMFQSTALSSLGLAFATGWIAGDNATAAIPTYTPKNMVIESEVAEQRMLNMVNKYFPALGGFVIKTAFSMQKKK